MRIQLKAATVAAVIVFIFGFGSFHTSADEKRAPATFGIASWYGGQFHGRTTASGERYNMDGLTAAHRSLPFGSTVRVTNQVTKASVVVRINDRGPFAGNRVIDLSRAAAKAVRMIDSGVAPVRLEVVRAAS